MECQIKVEQGILEGKISRTYKSTKYYSFEGVPYATPPVGKLRFKAPKEPDSWTGIRDAKKPSNKCAQINTLGNGILEGSEDCLYLNVYTPILPHENNKKLPVIFFIHGGRLAVGYGDYYKPDIFIEKDVILVTINYRLNIFGFLCLNIPEVPGNAGLKDSAFALKWVNRNIHNFNGDNNNVTIFGESAGAAIATSCIISKMTDGLFHKIICQSSSIITEPYYISKDPVESARKIASYLGENISNKYKLYDFLSNKSAEELVNAYVSADLSQPPAIINGFLLPVIERKFENIEAFFDEAPIITIQENRHIKVPILATLNSFDAAFFIRRDENNDIIYEKDCQNFIPRCLLIKHNTPKAVQFANNLQQYFFKNANDKKTQYLNLITDHYFTRDTILFVDTLSKHQKDVFLCRFGYNGNMNTRIMKSLGLKGASHGDLIQYQFYRENKFNVASKKDLTIVEIVSEAWCNFIKTGTPNLANYDLDWQPYDSKERICLNIEENIKVEPFPDYERIKFWFELINEKCGSKI